MKNQYLVLIVLVLQTADLIAAKSILRGDQSIDVAYEQFGDGDGPLVTKPQLTPGDHPPTVVQGARKDTPEGGFQRGAADAVGAVKWSNVSKFSKPVQYLFATLWVLMLAALPMIIPTISEEPVTKTQMTVGATMMVVLLGGFFLFTNIILFQSAHFDEIRPLTMIECIYFMSQVITTVGYGDIGPAKVRGQIFVALYVLGALFVIAMVVSELVEYMAKAGEKYKHELHKRMVEDYTTPRKPQTIHDLLHKDKPSYTPLLVSLGAFLALVVVWVLFFSMHPGEGKSVFQATYMSIITLSSVGLGYFTPVTEDGMIFGAFFMLFGTTSLAMVVGRFTELTVQLSEWERCHTESKKQQIEDLKAVVKGADTCSELDFVKFALLQMGNVDEEEIDSISRAFQNMMPKNGEVGIKDIEDNIMSYGAVTPR